MTGRAAGKGCIIEAMNKQIQQTAVSVRPELRGWFGGGARHLEAWVKAAEEQVRVSKAEQWPVEEQIRASEECRRAMKARNEALTVSNYRLQMGVLVVALGLHLALLALLIFEVLQVWQAGEMNVPLVLFAMAFWIGLGIGTAFMTILGLWLDARLARWKTRQAEGRP